jgi:hypothetical protein
MKPGHREEKGEEPRRKEMNRGKELDNQKPKKMKF